MKRSLVSLCLTTLYLNVIYAPVNGECESCVRIEECSLFGDMDQQRQQQWLEDHPCDGPERPGDTIGFAAVAKGDYVCCSASQWAFENAAMAKEPTVDDHEQPGIISYSPNDYREPPNTNRSPGYYPNNNFNYPDQNGPFNSRPNGYYPNDGNQRIGNFGVNQNPYFMGSNSFQANSREQCSDQLTSFPPKAESVCCGRDADSDRITGPSIYNQNLPQASYNQQNWMPRQNYAQEYKFVPLGKSKDRIDPEFVERTKRSPPNNNDNVTVSIDKRIAGGKETDFFQFPWTVFLRIAFDYGNGMKAMFSCGGSLISARYVLTAGHCLSDEKGKLASVEVRLAEFDKRTYPRDCKNVLGKGETCIDNVIIYAESVIVHTEFDDDRLRNDIALIRLRSRAPYTEYIRPICLPFIDIDKPSHSNLPLFAAGWGRDGVAESNIKQSTVVHLIPQRECSKSYPDLTRRHLCAAGYNGEDTCKGDSGGPLMVLYKGKYYVAGIVSGKRADSPCGTSVPSLYTNVYHYLDWIGRNIRN